MLLLSLLFIFGGVYIGAHATIGLMITLTMLVVGMGLASFLVFKKGKTVGGSGNIIALLAGFFGGYFAIWLALLVLVPMWISYLV